MADNVNINRSSGYDLLDNFPGAGLQDYHDATREYKPSWERPDWRVEAVRAVIVLVSLIIGWALWGLWKTSYCWGGRNWQACENLLWWEPLGALAAVLLVVGLPAWRVVLWGLGEWRLAQARAARVATTFNRFGDPQRIDVLLPLMEEMERYRLATQLKAQTAPYEMYHSVNTYSPSFQQPRDAAALPAPVDAPLVPWETWRQWADQVPHLMFAAETGGGKSTLAKAVLAPRIAGGEQAYIIDPHSDVWFDLPIMGGGENWDEVRQALRHVSAEYQRRIDERERYRRETGRALPLDHWTRLTVLLDEANITRLRLDTGARGRITPWQEFAQVLGSGARKVRISILLLCQSANVEDLGLSGPMRENFLRIALDSTAARKLIQVDEPNPERKKQLLAALDGMSYPAVAEHRGRVHLLDRTGLDRVPPPPNAAQAAWVPIPPAGLSHPEPTLAQRAATLLALFRGNRRAAARSLLAQRGLRVRGGWQWEVKEIARSLGMRDEDVSAIGRPAGTRNAA